MNNTWTWTERLQQIQGQTILETISNLRQNDVQTTTPVKQLCEVSPGDELDYDVLRFAAHLFYDWYLCMQLGALIWARKTEDKILQNDVNPPKIFTGVGDRSGKLKVLTDFMFWLNGYTVVCDVMRFLSWKGSNLQNTKKLLSAISSHYQEIYSSHAICSIYILAWLHNGANCLVLHQILKISRRLKMHTLPARSHPDCSVLDTFRTQSKRSQIINTTANTCNTTRQKVEWGQGIHIGLSLLTNTR